MSFYEPQGWQAPVRQASWEQPPPPSRSGTSSTSQREDGSAFATQFEEVDRAIDNLAKSGKFYSPGPRRDMLGMGSSRQFNELGSRMHGHTGRHSVSDFDPSRPHSASNLQNFYASQRYQGGRQSEAEQMMQAKRRMAAQRERELRNYHQEQQYNRSVLADMSSTKSDRSMSPSTLSEEGRRELIARQHRALYGNEFGPPSGFSDDSPREQNSGNGSAPGGSRTSPPRNLDPFGMPVQSGSADSATPSNAQENVVRGDTTTSPQGQSMIGFGGFDSAGQSSGKITTPPVSDENTHSRQISKSTTAPVSGGMAPIGSRPNVQQGLSKRTTSPLPSLNYGFGSSEQKDERSTSSNSNNNAQKESTTTSGMGAWGTGSGVWGSNKIGATSVWG